MPCPCKEGRARPIQPPRPSRRQWQDPDGAIGGNIHPAATFRQMDGMSGSTHEPEDIEPLLVSFAPRVYGLLVRLVGRPDVAEDLMQETMLRAFRSLRTYRPEGKFRAWIFRIAVNLARDWVRRRPHEPATVLDDPAETSPAPHLGIEAPPDLDAQHREQRRRVEAVLARLPAADREVLLLRFYGDMAFKDVAKATGEPLGTVLARAHRALKKLGAMFPEGDL